jgi:hypothetical protein
MYDPDIDDFDEALSVVNMYEWAIGNDIGIHTRYLLFSENIVILINSFDKNNICNLFRFRFAAPYCGLFVNICFKLICVVY